MLYTALGDSITFGENASSFSKSYPQLVIARYNSHSRSRRAAGYVLARSGWSSSDLLDAAIWRGSSIICQSDVVSVWIGGVDLMNAALVSLKSQEPLNSAQQAFNYSRNLHALFTQIKGESNARIICCTQYNPFPNSPLANESINQLNRTTSQIAQSCHVTIAPVHTWFEGRQADLIYGYRKGKIEDALSGSLPIHPNDQGHDVIATRLSPYLFPRKSSR